VRNYWAFFPRKGASFPSFPCPRDRCGKGSIIPLIRQLFPRKDHQSLPSLLKAQWRDGRSTEYAEYRK